MEVTELAVEPRLAPYWPLEPDLCDESYWGNGYWLDDRLVRGDPGLSVDRPGTWADIFFGDRTAWGIVSNNTSCKQCVKSTVMPYIAPRCLQT